MGFGNDYTLASAGRPGAWRAAAVALGLDPERTEDRAEDILRRGADAIDAAIDALDPEDRASPKIAALSRDVRAHIGSAARLPARRR